MLYRDQGVVLRTYKLGEADRIVVIATQAHGKIRAVAKGVRKTKSRFGGHMEPMSHVALQLYEGRELDTVTQAEALDAFRPIREDLDRYGKATNLLEAIDQVMQEREPNVRLYQMLVGALRSLAANDAPLLVPAFFLKLLSLEGVHPVLDQCCACATTVDLVAFDTSSGGMLCRDCRTGIPVSPDCLDLLRRILGGGLNAALQEPTSATTHDVALIANRAFEHHIERRMRSVGVFDRG
ncbi:MAG TPA: DNA repair protein RecO [Acidimicrobiales bacterium]|nr:DNA repair protein RecO [Acidimicrobiales bacterium]